MDRRELYVQIESNQKKANLLKNEIEKLNEDRQTEKDFIYQYEQILEELRKNCTSSEIDTLYKKHKNIISDELKSIDQDFQMDKKQFENEMIEIENKINQYNKELFELRRKEDN